MYALSTFILIFVISVPCMFYFAGPDEWHAIVTGQATKTQKWIASGGLHCSIAWYVLASFDQFLGCPPNCKCGFEIAENPIYYDRICTYPVSDVFDRVFCACRPCSIVRAPLPGDKGDKGETGYTGKGPANPLPGCDNPWCAPHGAPGVCSENKNLPIPAAEIRTTECLGETGKK
jgi:hypothetical protein